jgi:hypothetical protein
LQHAQAGDDDALLQAYIADLGQTDDRRVWNASVQILKLYVDQPHDASGMQAIEARLAKAQPEVQQTIIRAIGDFTDVPPRGTLTDEAASALIPIVRLYLGSPAPAVAKESLDALLRLDRAPAGRAAIESLITDIFARGDDEASIPEMIAAVRLRGARLPTEATDLKATVDWMIGILRGRWRKRDRQKYADLLTVTYKELQTLTGESFESWRDAEAWWEKNRTRAPLNWYREHVHAVERDVVSARSAARDWWRLYLTSINGDAAKLLRVLKDSLEDDVPQIRAEAVRELMRFAGRTDLADAQTQEAHDAVIAVLENETDLLVLRSTLEVLAESPPAETDPHRDKAAAAAARVLAANLDRGVRLAAIKAVGVLEAPAALPELFKELTADRRDVVLAEEALAAIGRIGARERPNVLSSLNVFLRKEVAQDSERVVDFTLLEAALKTIAAFGKHGDLSPTWPETLATVDHVCGLLSFQEPENAAGAGKVRQLAAAALRDLRHPAALPHLFTALKDKDALVARYVADAIGATARADGVEPAARSDALTALAEALSEGRPELQSVLVDNVRQVAGADVAQGGPLLAEVATKLANAATEPSDYGRLTKLLQDVPSTRPKALGEPVFERLRMLQAEAVLKSPEPDPATAVTILDGLSSSPPRDLLLIDVLIIGGGPESLTRAEAALTAALEDSAVEAGAVWKRRARLTQALAKSGGKAEARTLIQTWLALEDLPEATRTELGAQLKQLGPDSGGPDSEPPGGPPPLKTEAPEGSAGS